jgi:hypothetical protein
MKKQKTDPGAIHQAAEKEIQRSYVKIQGMNPGNNHKEI